MSRRSTHVPERTCIGCWRRAPRRVLLRVVRTAGGGARVDARGSAPGRGAYLHLERGCIDAALAKGRLARALRTGLDEDGAATLRAEIEGEAGR